MLKHSYLVNSNIKYKCINHSIYQILDFLKPSVFRIEKTYLYYFHVLVNFVGSLNLKQKLSVETMCYRSKKR